MAKNPKSDYTVQVAVLKEQLSEFQHSQAETQEQLIDELRKTEAKLVIMKETEKRHIARIEELETYTDNWRIRFEELNQENETLLRANDEVRNLEKAILRINEEKQVLYNKLEEALGEKRQLCASRDELEKGLSNANIEISALREKLQKYSAGRTQSTIKLLELEAENRKLKTQIEKKHDYRIKSVASVRPKLDKVELSNTSPYVISAKPRPCENEMIFSISKNDNTDGECLCIVSGKKEITEFAAIPRRQSICTKSDQLAQPYHIVYRLRSFLQLLPHRRIAVLPYIRLTMLGYFVFLNIVFLRYLFM